jgi:hypothetical protein
MVMVKVAPELNSKKSFSIPSLKITPFSGMSDWIWKLTVGVIVPECQVSSRCTIPFKAIA